MTLPWLRGIGPNNKAYPPPSLWPMSRPVVMATAISKIRMINATQPIQAQVGGLTGSAKGNDKSPEAGFGSAVGTGDADE